MKNNISEKTENLVEVTFENSKKIKVPYKTKIEEVLKLVEVEAYSVLAVRLNNEIKTYDYEIVKDSYLEFVNYSSDDGYRIYSRTLKMVLYMALTQLYSKADVEFMATINKDQYFVIKNINATEDKLEEVKAKMIEIIKKDFPIIKKTVSLEEAEVLYTSSNDECKLNNLSNKLKTYITMYFCNGLYNYFYGALAPSTGYVKSFDLQKYKDGAILVLPDVDMNTNKIPRDVRLYDTFIAYNKLNELIGLGDISQLNKAILNSKTNDIIQMSEAIHNRKLIELVIDIEKKTDIKMILIAGPSSSGKTTFAQKLGVQLNLSGYNPVRISMDNYFKERKDNPVGPDGKYDFERVDALDIDLFNRQMKDLIAGTEVELPEFDFMEGTKRYNGKKLRLQSNDIIIVEGIHALNPVLTEFVDNINKYKIYIAPIATVSIDSYTKVSSTDTRILRRMVRDYTTRNHSIEKTFDLWANVKKGEEKYIFPFVNDVDFIYNSSLIYEPCVMRTFAQPLLLQVDRSSVFYSESRRLYEFLNNFLPMDTTNIPIDSIMREFIGNGCFDR